MTTRTEAPDCTMCGGECRIPLPGDKDEDGTIECPICEGTGKEPR